MIQWSSIHVQFCVWLVRFIQRNATCWPLHFMWWASDSDSGVSWWAGPGETKAPCVAGHNTGNLEMPWVSCELAPIISHSPIPRSELLLNPLSRVVLCNADSVIMLLHYRPVHDQTMHVMWMNFMDGNNKKRHRATFIFLG